MSTPKTKSTGNLGPKTKSAGKKENAVKQEKVVSSKVRILAMTARINLINLSQSFRRTPPKHS